MALVLLGAHACLEPPVSESLDVRMRSNGSSIVSVSTALRDPGDYDKAPKVQQRLEGEAREGDAGSPFDLP